MIPDTSVKTDKHIKECMKKAIPEFLRPQASTNTKEDV